MPNKNKWEALSLRDRAFLIREAVRNGITDIDSIRNLYNQNGERIRLGTLYKTFESGSDYDYFNAAPENIPQEDDGHWGSRNPHTGQLLKSPNHPTYNLLLEGENQAGYRIQKIGDREYSFPNEHRFDGESNQNVGTTTSAQNSSSDYESLKQMEKEYFNMWSDIYAKGSGQNADQIRSKVLDRINKVPVQFAVLFSPNAAGEYDPGTDTITMHTDTNMLPKDWIPEVLIHERTHSLESSFPLNKSQEDTLLRGHPGNGIQKYFTEAHGEDYWREWGNYHLLSEARALNSQVRYYLYEKYKKDKTGGLTEAKSFRDYINGLSMEDMDIAYSGMGYYDPEDLVAYPEFKTWMTLPENEQLIAEVKAQLKQQREQQQRELKELGPEFKRDNVRINPVNTQLIELENALLPYYNSAREKYMQKKRPTLDARKKAILEIAQNSSTNQFPDKFMAAFGGNLE